MHIAHGRDTDLWELLGMNRRKEGAPFRPGATLAVAVAVSRDVSRASLRKSASR